MKPAGTEIEQSFKHRASGFRFTVKTKIWLTVLTVVLLFAFFILFYFPSVQESYILKNYNTEVQNLANTVSLGVKIALKEQNFEGVQTAFDFVKKDPHLEFVSLVQVDTTWSSDHNHFKIARKVFKTYPETVKIDVNMVSDEDRIVKRSTFSTPVMNGEIVLGFNTLEITQNKKQILITSLVVSSIVFVIGILMGFLLAKNISGPVLRLRDAANRVSEGDLTQRVENRSSDEIGELSNAFNKMVTDLSTARHEIEQRSEELLTQQEEIITQRDKLKETVAELKNTQQQLIQTEKLASLGELTAGIAHEIQNPLNFVNNFSEVNMELVDEIEEILGKHNNAEISDLSKIIKQNLEKILHHGKRADAIVKNMLQHSRINSGERQETDINKLTEEFVRLSYYGMRAKDRDFNAAILTNFASNLPPITVNQQDIGRVLINVFNNAFYAVHLKQKTGGTPFQPEIRVETLLSDNFIDIKVQDNGTGIPKAIKDKILEPFFTTKPTGEGTGLGLSLSYDILVKGYGGKINIESEEGKYSEFTISIPI
ncbi:MAG TPA: ATP-binding protein [Mucilaginibacter sp.]|jgi:signal transduction histidine kinase